MSSKKNLFHILFWLFIATSISTLMILYLARREMGIIPGIIPLLSAIISIYVGEKYNVNNKYFPTSIPGYLALNTVYFLAFMFVLFFVKDTELFIKIGAFIVMNLVGIYTSYFLLKDRKKLSN